MRSAIEQGTTAPRRMACRLRPGTIEQVRVYVLERLDQKLTSAMVAERVRLSRSHFCHAFKVTFGISLTKYVRALRMERACQLMMDTDLRLVEIAYECGLTDQSHLCRCFRARFGMPPSQWRRAAPISWTQA